MNPNTAINPGQIKRSRLAESAVGAGGFDLTAQGIRSHGVQDQIKQESEMDRVLERLARCADDLLQAINMLDNRLLPVIRPVNSAIGVAENEAPRPIRCRVSDSIESTSDTLCAMRDRVHNLLEVLAV